MTRQRSRVSLVDHIGENPFAAVLPGLLLLALLPADYYNLDLMLAGATNGRPLATHFIAATITVAMTLLAGFAASFVVKGARANRPGWWFPGALMGLAWLVSAFQLYRFRHENIAAFNLAGTSASNAGVQIVGAAPSPDSGGDHGLALTLTLLLLITGIIAAAIAVLKEDPEQHARRRATRVLLWLRWRHRHAVARADRRRRLADLRAGSMTSLATRHETAAKQVHAQAESLKEQVRLAVAKTLRDPTATTALQADRRISS